MARVQLSSHANGTLVDAQDQLVTDAQVFIYYHGTTTPVPVFADESSSTALSPGPPYQLTDDAHAPGWVDGPVKIDYVYVQNGLALQPAEADLIPAEVVVGLLPVGTRAQAVAVGLATL